MTVATTTITAGPFAGNGITATFSFDFRIDEESQLVVYETSDEGIVTQLELTTDFTVSGVGVDGGGSATRVAGALPSGYTWYMRRRTAVTQETNFSSQGGFFPDVHERALDNLTFMVQELRDSSSRALRLPESYSGGADAELPDPIPNGYVRWNSNGTALEADTAIYAILGNLDKIDAVYGSLTEIDALGAITTEIEGVYSVRTAVVTVASVADEVSAVGTSITAVVTVADNIEDVQQAHQNALDAIAAKEAAETARGAAETASEEADQARDEAVGIASAVTSALESIGGRNLLANGGLSFWQGGTSFTPSTRLYTADQWVAGRSAGTSGMTLSRQVGISSQYAMRLQRDSGNTSDSTLWVSQLLETSRVIELRGKTLTLSLKARVGANFSGGGSVSLLMQADTALDTAATYSTNGAFSGSPTTLKTQPTPVSETQSTISATTDVVVPADANSLLVRISYAATGTAGADDWLEIEDVQLEIGGLATPFEIRPLMLEYLRCAWFYEAKTVRTENGSRHIPLLPKRVTPSITTSAGSASNITTAGFELSHTSATDSNITANARI